MAVEYQFLRAHAAQSVDGIGLMSVPDDYVEFAPPSSYLRFTFDKAIQPQWGGEVLDYWITGFSTFALTTGGRRRVCCISAEGDIIFFEDENIYEKIQGAGLNGPDTKYYGRMDDIAGIGGELFACGGGGQIYKRFGDKDWRSLAPELLRKPDSTDNDWFVGIGGPAQNDVYFAGKAGRVAHWDGEKVTVLQMPTRAFLVWVRVENENSIWIGGANGALLNGNWRDGFRLLPGINGEHHLNAAAFYGGQLYLGSSSNALSGLYRLEDAQLRRVGAGLKPELTDVSFVDAGAGVLWAIGEGKDIVHFDGKAWERIDFPHNAPIR